MSADIIKNIETIKQRIFNACKKCSRNYTDVRLMLVTKTVHADKIKLALENGYHLVGENKAQELKQKSDFFKSYNAQAHFIGHLQSNKIKDVLPYVSCVQSLDSLKLAEKLHMYLEKHSLSREFLIQVNVSEEDSKFGIDPREVVCFVKKLSEYKTLKIKGLMTIGLLSENLEKVRAGFKLLKKLQRDVIELNLESIKMDVLSMGMSKDLEIAIEEGSTMIRVGTDIFGKRKISEIVN